MDEESKVASQSSPSDERKLVVMLCCLGIQRVGRSKRLNAREGFVCQDLECCFWCEGLVWREGEEIGKVRRSFTSGEVIPSWRVSASGSQVRLLSCSGCCRSECPSNLNISVILRQVKTAHPWHPSSFLRIYQPHAIPRLSTPRVSSTQTIATSWSPDQPVFSSSLSKLVASRTRCHLVRVDKL